MRRICYIFVLSNFSLFFIICIPKIRSLLLNGKIITEHRVRKKEIKKLPEMVHK